MKRLKSYWSKSWGRILSSLLTLLGFSACNTACDNIDPGDQPLMYGTPTASFSIKGKVENTQGNSLPRVRVVIPFVESCRKTTSTFIPDYPLIVNEIRDTLYTDTDGKFEWRGGAFPSDTIRYELQFDDMTLVEGKPRYQSDTLKVSFLPKDLVRAESGNVWNYGRAEKEITVVLKEKENEQ